MNVDVEQSGPVGEPIAPAAGRPGLLSGLSPLRLVVASASGAAAAVHFGMVPSHGAESTLEAVGFGIAGWLGVIFALAVLLRPTLNVLLGGAFVHLTFVGIWALSRTVGLPVGAHSGVAEPVTSIDLFATALEAFVVLGALALTTSAASRQPAGPIARTAAGLLSTAAMVGATIALVSPSAQDHASSGHDHVTDTATVVAAADGTTAAGTDLESILAADIAASHSHDSNPPALASTADSGDVDAALAAAVAESTATSVAGTVDTTDHHATAAAVPAGVDLSKRCDLAFNPVAFWQETLIVNGGGAKPFEGSAELDSLIRLTTQPNGAEAKDAAVVSALGTASDETYTAYLNWLPAYSAAAHAAAATAAPDDNAGHGGHLGPQAWTPMTDQAQCDELAAQLDTVTAIALKYPHPADAEAAGWRRVTGYVPGIAAHYMNFGYVDGQFKISEPEMLLYDGDDPASSMVGVSYYLIHDSDYEPTQGFVGPNDHFHRHVGLCIDGTGVIGDSATTDEECAARGGVKQGGTGGWMNHVWIVPGCESPWGVFSGASPLLEGGLRQASGSDGGGCAGSAVTDRYDLSPGQVATVPSAIVAGASTAGG